MRNPNLSLKNCDFKINDILIKMILVVCIFIFGCIPGPLFVETKDISHEKDLWKDYQYYGIYKLKVDVFLRIRDDVPTPNKSVLVPPREKTEEINNLLYSAPKNISDYKKNQDKWHDIEGIIGAGTKIQCTKLLRYSTMSYGSSLYIYAKIIDGPYSGRDVEISDLSVAIFDQKRDLYLLSPNPKLLSLYN